MGLIKLEPAVLRRAAKDLNQSISQLGSVNNLIQSVAPEIEYNWQSEYTPEYLECLEALRQNTRKIRMELEDIQRASAALQLVQSRPTGKRSRRSTESNKL
ncbi:MAG: hypothetical protein ACLS3C_11795 [Oscillospiraceae bacterium]